MRGNLQQQGLRLTQLTQDYHPIMRRRAYTSIRTSFPSFFATQTQNNLISMNQSQKLILQNFNKINHIIDMVDDHIRRRIQCYENEVVNVVQKQIDQMRQQTQKVVSQFNSMIQQKNKQNQIWSLNNQLDYFKSQAKKLFQSNKKLTKQNADLRHKFKQYEWELENKEVVMQKLWYKYQKEKHHKGKLKTMMDQSLQNIQRGVSQKIKTQTPQIMEFSLKQDVFSIDQMPQIKLNSIKPTKNIKEQSKINSIEQQIEESQRALVQNNDNSLLMINYQDQSEVSKIQFKGKSISINQIKLQMKDQQSQANIYLSQYSYKSLFDKKGPSKRITKNLKQIAIQTDNEYLQNQIIRQSPFNKNRQNMIQFSKLNSPKRSKQINFTKNGFYINQVIAQKTHYRSISSKLNSTYKQSLYNFKDKKQRLATQNNFNKSSNQNYNIQLITHKTQKSNKKLYNKMASRFQRNKIVQKAYDKSNSSNLYKSFQK